MVKRLYEPILITGVPTSGKSTICNVFANFKDRCNVIDSDQYGEWTYDSVAQKAIWSVEIIDLKNAIDAVSDKPTIVVGVSDNIDELFEIFKNSCIYVIEYQSEVIAKRLNIRYDRANHKEKVFWQTVYGLRYHNAGSVDKTFAKLNQNIWRHKSDYNIITMPIMNVVANVAILLDGKKKSDNL